MYAQTTEPSSRTHSGHAVVIGGSMAGLLAARVLTDRFERVTLVERDRFPDGAQHRKGVPQGHHLHALLGRGLRTMEGLFPGLEEELIDTGATPADVVADTRFFQFGDYKARFASGVRGIALGRPLLDSLVRRRVLGLSGIETLQPCSVVGVLTNADRSRIAGIRYERKGDGTATELPADLVVDASGRGSRTPAWLKELGYPGPEEESIRIGLGYTTRLYRRKPEHLAGSIAAILVGEPPAGLRCGGILAIEGDRWIVTLCGFLGDHAPTDDAGFVEFAQSLPAPDVYNVIREAEPVSEVSTYKFPASLRRRYERLERFPGGLLVLGDALCSFNPLYGQGMSVAAVEAEILRDCLAEQEGKNDSDLYHRFFRRAARFVDTPWSLTAGADFAYSGVEGKRPMGTDLINAYMVRVHRAATKDHAVCRTFFEVIHLLRPPSHLFRPGIAWRALRKGAAPA